MLTGSASRTENGTFDIPPLFRVESTVNVVVRTMFDALIGEAKNLVHVGRTESGKPRQP